MVALPLKGIRILDLSIWWAGPLGTMFLADMGAEVIKVEAVQRLDGYRGTFPNTQYSSKSYETSPAFNTVNRNKLDITLNLNSPKGVELAKRLVKLSDVVYENYTPRVMESFGLGYSTLKKINPSIILVSVTGFGESGPWRDYASFAATSESMAGLPAITGYPGGPPIIPGAVLADPLSGLYGALATLAALRFRQRTGKGQHVDISLLETTSTLLGDVLMDFAFNRRVSPRQANRHPHHSPHDVYRCRGEDEWVAIVVRSQSEWERLCKAIGKPNLAKDGRFNTSERRHSNEHLLKPIIQEWTSQKDKKAVMEVLQKLGVSAGAVLSAKDLLENPHLRARGFFQRVNRKEVGTHPYPSMPLRFARKTFPIRKPAPLLGEHNQYVFGEMLGLSQKEIQQLADEQVIGNEPVNLPPAR